MSLSQESFTRALPYNANLEQPFESLLISTLCKHWQSPSKLEDTQRMAIASNCASHHSAVVVPSQGANCKIQCESIRKVRDIAITWNIACYIACNMLYKMCMPCFIACYCSMLRTMLHNKLCNILYDMLYDINMYLNRIIRHVECYAAYYVPCHITCICHVM